jgi:hypothetical protein
MTAPTKPSSRPEPAPRKGVTIDTLGYAAQSETTPLAPFRFQRREPGPRDVQMEILYCGVCHSDLHQVRNEWKGTTYPIVPGHEIVGRVTRVGDQVSSFKPGDLAAVGCMVDSCRTCPNCREDLEQYCDNELILTYNSPDKHTGAMTPMAVTPTKSSWTSTSCLGWLQAQISPARRRCSAPGSPPTHPCAIGRSVPATRWASLG